MKYYQPYGETDTNASYTNGNASAGVPGSIPDARAIEQTMREVVEVINYAGLTPSATSTTQLRQAIVQLIAATAISLSTDGTMTANSDLVAPSQKATRTYVAAAIAALVNSSPSTLDTLNELAAALGNDPNFATTMTTLIGTKAAKAQNDGFCGEIDTAVNRDYVICLRAPFDCTITGFATKSQSGTCTATLKNAGASVVANSVSTTLVNTTSGLSNATVTAGSVISITVSSNSAAKAIGFEVSVQRSLA